MIYIHLGFISLDDVNKYLRIWVLGFAIRTIKHIVNVIGFIIAFKRTLSFIVENLRENEKEKKRSLKKKKGECANGVFCMQSV